MADHPLFAVCIRNSEYLASLDLRKLYEIVEDPEAAKDDMIRVIDESGESNLYSSDRFVLAPLPESVEQAVLQATEVSAS